MPGKKDKKTKKSSAVTRWWRETLGELRKVTWPTPQEAWQLTKVVALVMLAMSVILGILDFVFTRVIAFILS